MKITSVGIVNRSKSISPKQFRKGLGGLAIVIALLIVLAKIPATSNWPVVSWVKSLISRAITSDEQSMKLKHDTARNKTFITSETLSNGARNHSVKMAGRGSLYHESRENLIVEAKMVCSNQVSVGENIGYAGAENIETAMDKIFGAWMASPGHRGNIMDSSYTHIGVGQYWKDGTLWSTVRFVVCPGASRSTTTNTTSEGSNTTQNTTSSSQAAVGPTGYTLCAQDGQTCVFGGWARVLYGTSGAFKEKKVAGCSTVCSSGNFGGDPKPGYTKACFFKSDNTWPTPAYNLKLVSKGTTSFSISWTNGGDPLGDATGGQPAFNSGMKNLRIFINDAVRGDTASLVTSSGFSNLNSGCTYKVEIASIDWAGNMGTKSAALYVTTNKSSGIQAC